MPRISRGVFFVLPTVVFLAAFIAYPLVATVVLSVTNSSGSFVGTANFAEALGGRVTRIALQNTVVYVGASIVFQMLIGTFAGIVLEQPFRGRSFLRAIILIPWIVPGVVAATTWAWMFHTEFGIVNYLLVEIGLIERSIGWLVRGDTVMPALIAVNTWKMYPFVAVMVLAGLQGIPASLYEAARVDGATFWHEVRYITLPQLRPVLGSVLLLLLIWGFNAITLIYTMTRGGPANRSLIVPIQIFRQAFEFFDFHLAAATSVLLFLFLTALIAGYLRLFGRAEAADG